MGNKRVEIGCNVVKNPYYDDFILEKEGYNKHLGENGIEWLLYEMLEIEINLKKSQKRNIDFNPSSVNDCDDDADSASHAGSAIKKKVGYVENNLKKK